MNRNLRRILSAGVSGLAVAAVPVIPALAATVPGYGDTDANPDASLVFDLSDITNSGNLGIHEEAVSTVNSTANGLIDLSAVGAESAALDITNDGTILILAEGTAGNAAIEGVGITLDSTATEGPATNDFANTGSIGINAVAANVVAGTVLASVDVGLLQTVDGTTTSDASFSNSDTGSFIVSAESTVTSPTSGVAGATVFAGAGQIGVGPDVGFVFDNGGEFSVLAESDATGGIAVGNTAEADAVAGIGGFQFISGADTGTAELTNSGEVAVTADASATAYDAAGNAVAGIGFGQLALGVTDVNLTATNKAGGKIDVTANASGLAPEGVSADATALALIGVGQAAIGFESATLTTDNAGTVNVTATATSTVDSEEAFVGGTTNSVAIAGIAAGQIAIGGDTAELNLDNQAGGAFNVTSTATATGDQDDGVATGSAISGAGALQLGSAETVTGDLNNNGAIGVTSTSTASAAAAQSIAISGIGAGQVALGGDVDFTLTNAPTAAADPVPAGVGTIDVTATANASGDDSAEGFALAGAGAAQAALFADSASLELTNDGVIGVSATVDVDNVEFADGAGVATGQAIAAIGVGQIAIVGDGPATLTAANTADAAINVAAVATVDGDEFGSGSAIAGVGVAQFGVSGGNEAAADLAFTNDGIVSVTGDATVTGESAEAAGIAGAGVLQVAFASTAGALSDATATTKFVNSETGTVDVLATAGATANGVAGNIAASEALAGIGVSQSAAAGAGAAPAGAAGTIDNAGAINVGATATSSGTGGSDAVALSEAGGGFAQEIESDEGDAVADLQNSGDITVNSAAVATAAGTGEADAFSSVAGGFQFVEANDADHVASANIDNSGLIDVTGSASASGATGLAVAEGIGIVQEGVQDNGGGETAGTVDLTLTNTKDGVINVGLDAEATGATGGALASANLEAGIIQAGYSDDSAITADVANAGEITLSANAEAAGVGGALAVANIDTGIGQDIMSYDTAGEAAEGQAIATVDNTGTIGLAATATSSATGAGSASLAFASIGGIGSDAGISQQVVGSQAVITNSGDATFSSTAISSAVGEATAFAISDGADQYATAPVDDPDAPVTSFTNTKDGLFEVTATAEATASDVVAGDADAFAFAYGLDQNVLDDNGVAGTAEFSNAGDFNVAAEASASGAVAGSLAFASAEGVEQNLQSPGAVVEFDNSGSFDVSSTATSANLGVAVANAEGLTVNNDGGPVAGEITNSGNFTVVANAAGDDLAANQADAVGIWLNGDAGDVTVTNTGTLSVDAVISPSTGGSANATGILVTNAAGTGPVTILNQAGKIVVRESTDGGATYTWGDAISTDGATTPVAIVLEGGASNAKGNIYGNIEIKDTDTITVQKGETRFDGLVNAAAYNTWKLGGDPTVLGTGEADGSLTIAAGGTLLLADSSSVATQTNGPSHVFVDSFTVAPAAGSTPAGVLALELPAGPTAVSPSETPDTYPSVVANTANITGGTLEVRPISTNGLYANSYTYEDVIDANVLTGTFGTVRSTSVLLTPTASYDANDNVDLKISRVAFDAVAGLTINQTSVGGGIENVYTPTLTGAFAGVVADLFLIGDANTYADALDQLSGVQYAGYLRKLGWMGTRFNGLLSDMSECQRGTVVSELCRDAGENGVRVWGKLNYGKTDTDGDVEAGGFKTDQWFAALGVDFSVGPDAILGIAGAYIENKMKFDEFNGSIDSKGWQLGVYGAYDPGQYYIKGAVSYSDLNADSYREVAIGTRSTGSIEGSPDAKIWAANLEAGYRIALGANATLTPYAQFDYAKATMKRFDETGLAGADLSVRGSDEFAASELGLELSGQMGGIVPSLKLGWQHAFSSGTADFSARFIDAPAGSDFRIISEDFSKDSAIVEVGLAGKLSPNFDASIGYQGRFSSDVERHAGMISLSYLFGAAPPPPPPAPPPPPPPPPPAPPVAECQKGPYIVFFDWDKSDITAEAAGILDSAVTAYGNCDVVPIMLAGYTDTSGSKQYNLGLAGRRNDSVRGYLTARNIPNDRITSQAFGEANPRVPTGDGVRELQNRRVEITYGPGSGM